MTSADLSCAFLVALAFVLVCGLRIAAVDYLRTISRADCDTTAVAVADMAFTHASRCSDMQQDQT